MRRKGRISRLSDKAMCFNRVVHIVGYSLTGTIQEGETVA